MNGNNVLDYEQALTAVEKVMMGQPVELTETERQQYRAGYIDCLQESGRITNQIRLKLYNQYGPKRVKSSFVSN